MDALNYTVEILNWSKNMSRDQVMRRHDCKPIFAFVVNFHKEKRKLKNKELLLYFCVPFKHLQPHGQ